MDNSQVDYYPLRMVQSKLQEVLNKVCKKEISQVIAFQSDNQPALGRFVTLYFSLSTYSYSLVGLPNLFDLATN